MPRTDDGHLPTAASDAKPLDDGKCKQRRNLQSTLLHLMRGRHANLALGAFGGASNGAASR
eukprot:7369757-Pyramimonas_sp.AAC.1